MELKSLSWGKWTKKDKLNRCGIVLAAGEGKRIQPFVRQLRGDSLPKQFVSFIGRRSMLEHTFHRAERLIAPERLFTVINFNHLIFEEAVNQLSNRPSGTVVLQPENKDTGPGILLPLIHLYKYFPDSVVAVFPSDHFILQEALFMSHFIGFPRYFHFLRLPNKFPNALKRAVECRQHISNEPQKGFGFENHDQCVQQPSHPDNSLGIV